MRTERNGRKETEVSKDYLLADDEILFTDEKDEEKHALVIQADPAYRESIVRTSRK